VATSILSRDAKAEAFKPSYAPSFVDKLMDLVKRLPIPYWLTYMILFVVQVLVLHVIAWLDGWIPFWTFNSVLLIFPLWLYGPLAIMTYLDAVAVKALANYRPLLDVSLSEMQRLEYEFTTMPSKSVLVSTVFWLTAYVVTAVVTYQSFRENVGMGQLLMAIVVLGGFVTYGIGSAIYYHSLRTLVLVQRTVAMTRQFDLFRLEPVYAFSSLTARTGVVWILLLTATLLVFPVALTPAPVFVLLGLQVVFAMCAFALPLRFVNRRLVAEKRKFIGEVDQRIKTMLERLNSSVDAGELSTLEELNTAISGLTAEKEILAKIPTWPWRAGLFAGFASIVVLPIALFMVQLVLSRWWGQ
jgi:hypothetical protein